MSDDLRHSPNCSMPGTETTKGYSCTVTRCRGCGCLSTTRNTPSTTPRKKA